MELSDELTPLFDRILEEVADPEMPYGPNPFRSGEFIYKKNVYFRPITPISMWISDDALYASVSVSKSTEDQVFTRADIDKVIAAKHVTSGINEEAITRMVEEQIFGEEIIVAKGLPAVDGKDGGIVKLFENGDADISEGDVICNIIPAEEGCDGFDVFGNILYAQRGRAPVVPQGENTCLSEDKRSLVAAASGRLHFSNGVYSVRNEYVVQGDLIKWKESIIFSGDVTIRGNCKGVEIKSTGTVCIFGSVSESVITGKKIIISFSVENSKLYATEGNIKMNNCEESSVICDGNIEASSFNNCTVSCTGEITCLSGLGSIFGGEIRCIKKITCLSVGNRRGDKTIIELGNASEYERERNNLMSQINKFDEDIERIEKQVEQFNEKKAAVGSLSKADEDFLNAAVRIKIQKTMEKEPLQKRAEHLDKIISGSQGATLRAMRHLNPGVSIMINDKLMDILQEYGKSTLYANDIGIVMI